MPSAQDMRMAAFARPPKERGNMLVLVLVFLAFVALAVIIGLSFGGLFFIGNRLQTSADEIALAGARKLNEFDRLGQMNNLVARARHLVYTSREASEQVLAGGANPPLERLAKQLLDEARDSASSLEHTRTWLAEYSAGEAITVMGAKFDQVKNSYPMVLPWLKVEMPQLVHRTVGRTVNVQSNVEELTGIPELAHEDRSNNYVKTSPALNLYKERVDARLPSHDGDLEFKLSPLPAPYQKSLAPARIVLCKDFRSYLNLDYTASACRVVIKLKLATGLGPSAGSELQTMGCAAATGGDVFE